ncbi:MAG: PKD domain-containing protein [Flavobacteriia bacterium]|jgi:PKD repeat protein
MKQILTFLVVFASFYASSQAVARITSPDQTICACDNATLSSSTSTAGGSPIVRTIWSIIGPGGVIADTTNVGTNEILPLCTPGTYDISIINQHQNGTTSVAQEFGFLTVSAKPTAGINAIVNSCTVPFGVTYSNTNPVPGVTAAWTFEGGNPATFNGDNPPLMSYNTAGSYDVQLIVTDAVTGCKDTAFRTMNVSNFDAAIILPTGNLCAGEPLQFTDNSTVGANTWNWTFENGSSTSSSAQNPVISFPAGTHDITLQSGNTSIGCNGFITAQITVVAKPTPSFTIDATTGCAPLTACFTNTSAPGTTFVWTYGDGTPNFTGQNSPCHTYTGNGSFSPTLTMTANGCTATVSGGPIVLTSPVAAFTITENNLCEPKNVTLNPSGSTAPGPIVSYTWIFDDGTPNVINASNANVNHDYMCGKYTPSLVIAMANGCRDTVQGTEIKVGTTLNVGFEGDTLLQCIKKPITLHSTTVIDCQHDPSDLIYFWSFENAPEAGDSIKLKIFPDTMLNIAYATDVALQIDFRGCKSSDTIVDYLYIKAPVSRFKLDTLLFCDPAQNPGALGKVVTVDDLASIYGHIGTITHSLIPPLGSNLETVPDQAGDDVVVTYKWDDGTANTVIEDDALLEDADKGATTHTFNQYGTYTVWQIIENRSTECIDSTSTTVHVSWITTDYVFDIAGPDSVCINTPFEFTSTSGTHGVPTVQTEPHSPLSYSFDMISGGTVTGSGSTVNQTFSHTYFVPGDYDVVLTTTNSVGCQATATDHITAFALPVASFTLDDVDGCIGIEYTSTATNTSTHPAGSFGAGGPATANWAASNAFHWTITPNGGTVTNPTLSVYNPSPSSQINSTTTFSLFVIDGFGCQSAPVSVTANVQQPQADFILPPSVCNGTTVDAIDNSSGAQPMQRFWFFNTGIDATPDGTGPVLSNTLTSAGLSQTYSYQLIVIDAGGCPDTSAVQTVTVSKPVADFTDFKNGSATDADGNFVCPPVVVNFTNTSQSVNAITSTQWHLGLNQNLTDPYFGGNNNGVTSTQASPNGMQYLFAGTYDLYLIIQDAIGCIDTMFVDDYLVIQGPSALPLITSSATVCGQTFDFAVTNPNNVVSWSWNLGDASSVISADEADNAFNHTYSGVQTYYPILSVVDGTGCVVNYVDTVTIQPNGVTANFTLSPDVVNLGTVVTMNPDGSVSTGGNISSWVWTFGDGTDSTLNTGSNVTHQYYVGGDIFVTLLVTDDRGCSDDMTLPLTIDVKFEMPNVFTGFGSDGPNADLQLFADVFKDFEILIVNRWGNVVYEGVRDPQKGRYLWNGIDQQSGKLCNDGTYFYKLKGVLKNDVEVNIHGFVTLIASTRP